MEPTFCLRDVDEAQLHHFDTTLFTGRSQIARASISPSSSIGGETRVTKRPFNLPSP